MNKYYLDLKIGDKLNFNTGLEMLVEDANPEHINLRNAEGRATILNIKSTYFLNNGLRIVYLGKRNRGKRGYVLIYLPDNYRYERVRET